MVPKRQQDTYEKHDLRMESNPLFGFTNGAVFPCWYIFVYALYLAGAILCERYTSLCILTGLTCRLYDLCV